MPRRLVYAPRARDDLEEARRWLTQHGSGPRAWRILAAMTAEIRGLLHRPCLHPVGLHPGVRELPTASGYRVFSEVDPDTGRNEDAGDVRVLRICGPGQDRRGFGRSNP